jgi:polysaccharide export outer membrane protein
MRFRNSQILVILAAASIGLPINALAQSAASQQPAQLRSVAHALRISSGDLLDVSVFDTPELSGKLRVDEAGAITLPVAGAIRVADMTSGAAAVTIEDKLRSMDVLKYPHVTVFISEYATQGVTVMGEVKTPGVYSLLKQFMYGVSSGLLPGLATASVYRAF